MEASSQDVVGEEPTNFMKMERFRMDDSCLYTLGEIWECEDQVQMLHNPENHLRHAASTQKNTEGLERGSGHHECGESMSLCSVLAPSQKGPTTKAFCEYNSDVRHSSYICNCWKSCEGHMLDENGDCRAAVSQAAQLGHLGGDLGGDEPSRCTESGDSYSCCAPLCEQGGIIRERQPHRGEGCDEVSD
ncbi:hypothetical protein HPG69_007211 [Diceros bicornis minor]|uniref:Uncharacterized protein n=1 Tax=Diceros bicornis minor TaxID=77932 RepID=A0A7J7FNC2_DICBM|nr:hypothetical protein HPG69_007211 [Diceros bicornis minor]